MKDKNPIDSVKFYGKHKPDGMVQCLLLYHEDLNDVVCHIDSFNAQEGDFSTLMPSVFGEILLRVYTKEDRSDNHYSVLHCLTPVKPRYYAVIQKGYGEILKTLDDGGIFRRAPPTPPITEAPTTPRALSAQPGSRNTSFSSVATLGGPEPVTPGAPQPTKKSTPFANNVFAQVPSTFVPQSPAEKHRRVKRRTESDGSMGTPKALQVGEPLSASASGTGSIAVLQRAPSPSPVRKTSEPTKLGLSTLRNASLLSESPSLPRTRSMRRKRDEGSDAEPEITVGKKKRL